MKWTARKLGPMGHWSMTVYVKTFISVDEGIIEFFGNTFIEWVPFTKVLPHFFVIFVSKNFPQHNFYIFG